MKDATSGQPTVARISLQEVEGRFHAPPGSLHRSLRGRGHFYCDRTAELTVPAGTYHLSGYRGPEYKVAARLTMSGVDPHTRQQVKRSGIAIVHLDDGRIGQHWVRL